MSISPIYRFNTPKPFSGDKIYNPYASFDKTIAWKRANFHTHTKIDGLFNECPEYPDAVWEDYQQYNYEILSFSNHNALTTFPNDSTRQIWVYEHGYNPFKFHKLTFAKSTLWYDNLLPVFPSQKQFMFNLLGKNSDMIVFNHPDRTFFVSSDDMTKLGGYNFVEAYAGIETNMRHWDEALKAGHYSHCILNDDCHNSDNPYKIAIRCTWLNSPSYLYEDVKNTLLSGCYYSMSLPSWADKDKIENNRNLPYIEDIKVQSDTITLDVSGNPLGIKAIGEDGLVEVVNSDIITFALSSHSYIRFEIEYPNGVKIFTNAFARYNDISELSNPAITDIRIFATILFNLAILSIVAILCLIIKKLFDK